MIDSRPSRERSRPRLAAALLASLLTAACGHTRVGGVRFANEDPVWVVDDRIDIPKPDTAVWNPSADPFHYSVTRPITDAMDVPAPTRAANINSVGGVPDSTWFVNRIGRGGLSPQDVADGPGERSHPADGPLRVVGGKPAGAAPGLMIEDSRGARFILKFDARAQAELDTGADVVVQRLLWAVGYHVAQDEVVRMTRERLVPHGRWKDDLGRKHPITDAYIDGQLARIERASDGSFRALSSKFLPGEPVGGYSMEGIRPDDTNDVVPHEDRRDLRGQYVFFGWLAHADIKRDNRVDVWVEDPRNPEHHFLMHYLVDFDQALGASINEADGLTANFDYRYVVPSLVTLGLWRRPWEGYSSSPGIAGVGFFDSEHFRPQMFRVRTPYLPFRRFDAYDGLWAAEILLRLSPEHIRAAVEQARHEDPRATEYLVRVLVERQHIAARHFLGEVAAVDRFSVTEHEGRATVCGVDLWLRYELGPEVALHHAIDVFDRAGWPLRPRASVRAGADGRLCIAGIEPPTRAEGYFIVGFHVQRDGEALPPVWVHLARSPQTGALRVIGVHRE